MLPDGSVWRVERTPEGTGRRATWTGEEWASVSAPDLSTLLGRGPARYSFAITSDGPTWLGVDHGTGGGSARYENGRWQVVTPPGEDALRIHGLAARDDVLWVLAEVVADPSAKPATTVLLRHEADSWQIFGPSEGLPQVVRGPWTDWHDNMPVPLAVDYRGHVWMSPENAGLLVFDGVAFRCVATGDLRHGALDNEVGQAGIIWLTRRQRSPDRIDPTSHPSASGGRSSHTNRSVKKP